MIIPHAFRLTQGVDLKKGILHFVQGNNIQAGSLLSGIGCLSKVIIRLADESKTIEIDGPLEILTLSGTLTPQHVHLHISVADKKGQVIGGHLVEGSIVSYTAEVCLMSFTNLSFKREYDPSTRFDELKISTK
ncbi:MULTISPECIES: PPC domain-containing DNA-binding protein [unclassified Photobacterium]|uniref:PPC domain-containing DNA-binding protein n=1 Tax=unclassified Photobacterium TaxID=2628852 RepID=UPI001EDE839D|nr:DNA-binding protein [Photobacterium sp. Ph6]MCG3874974.1 DNA-binding protein [Photobacterium sp. Ph5]